MRPATVSKDMCAAVQYVLRHRCGDKLPARRDDAELMVDLRKFAAALDAGEITAVWHNALSNKLVRKARGSTDPIWS